MDDCGIYALRFNGTDKLYIGQTTSFTQRLKQHKALFKSNKSSKKLQQAYNIYGMPDMEILEYCKEDELNSLEEEFIEIYNSISNGYNSRSSATGGNSLFGESNGNSIYSNEQIINSLFLLISIPKLTYPEITKITKVAKGTLVDIANGTGHKWLNKIFPEEYNYLLSFRHKRNTRLYKLIKSPEGKIYKVEHLTKFCNEHNLDNGNISKLLRGLKKQYLGWTAVSG